MFFSNFMSKLQHPKFSEISVWVIRQDSAEIRAVFQCSLVSGNCSSHLGEDEYHCEALYK